MQYSKQKKTRRKNIHWVKFFTFCCTNCTFWVETILGKMTNMRYGWNVVQFIEMYFDVKECSEAKKCEVGSRLYKSGSASVFN